jgi:hypothetical protein
MAPRRESTATGGSTAQTHRDFNTLMDFNNGPMDFESLAKIWKRDASYFFYQWRLRPKLSRQLPRPGLLVPEATIRATRIAKQKITI